MSAAKGLIKASGLLSGLRYEPCHASDTCKEYLKTTSVRSFGLLKQRRLREWKQPSNQTCPTF